MAMAKRYVPPGAKHKETAGATTKNAEDSQRSLDDLVQDKGGEMFVVKLRSKTKYSDLPFRDVSDKEESDSSIQQFEFQFNYKQLRRVMLWFREIGWKDQDAVLQFPSSLEKTQRKQVHEIAQSFGLGTSSSGFGETVELANNREYNTASVRYISVYSVEKATLGVGKVNLTKQEREKANVIWRLVKQGEDDKYKKFSHNEIEEMVLANKLDPSLQELWDKRASLLVDDFAEKCQVSEK